MTKRLTQEEKDNILKLYQEGMSKNQIKLATGRSADAIDRGCRP